MNAKVVAACEGYKAVLQSYSDVQAEWGTTDLDEINRELANEARRSHGGNVGMWATAGLRGIVFHYSW